jgi:PAS domain S-box-containing protein
VRTKDLCALAGCLVIAAALRSVTTRAQSMEPVKRVLLLHQSAVGEPIRAGFDAAFVEAIHSASSVHMDLYEETIETARFPGADLSRLQRDYLRQKYRELPLDVIVAQGMPPLNFVRANHELFGNAPIVAVVSPAGQITGRSDDATGLQGGFWISGVVDLALALLPDTDSVIVIDGARQNVGEFQPEVERIIGQRVPHVGLTYLRDLPLSDVVARVSAVPGRAVIVFVRQTMRTRTTDTDQFAALAEIERAAHVPVFSQVEDYLGRGILGGSIWRYEIDARRLAGMARAIAGGARAADIPAEQATYATMLDWRQLQRWHIPASRIPPGAVVLYRERSFFELYRRYVISAVGVFSVQLVLIVALVAQRAWRRRAEARYQSVVETQTELICRFTPDSTLTFVNDAYCRFWNKPAEALLGRKFIELIPRDDRDAVLARIQATRRGVDSHEHRVTMTGGGVGWQHWINSAIVDDSGRLIEIQGVGRDISDRKRAEEALAEAEARNTAMLRAIPDLIFVLLRDGTYLDYHATDETLLFVPPPEFMGRRIRDVFPAELAETFMDAIQRASDSSEPVVIEYDLPFDPPRSFEMRIVNAGSDRVLTMVRDVTASRRAAALNHDLAGRLIASQEDERQRIARELHDNLGQEISLLKLDLDQLASKMPADATQSRLLEIAERSGALATDVHYLSHDLHPARLHTLGLVASMRSLCRDTKSSVGVEVTFDHEGLPATGVDANVSLCLYRILQEALNNVGKHSRARTASVRLTVDDDALSLHIADSGVGFAPQSVETEGLGLVSMRERVGFLNGKLAIHSRTGGGTRIGVRIPVPVAGGGTRLRPDVQAT